MNDAPTFVWGAMNWLAIVGGIAVLFVLLLLVGYWRAGASGTVRVLAALLKSAGVAILALCLLEPLFSGQRARPGANQFAILVDNSQSMTLKDASLEQNRSQQLLALAGKSSPWLAQLGRDFDLRTFAFDAQLRSVDALDGLAFDGSSSGLGAALDRLARRFQGRPLAGVILFTDGIATDADTLDRVLARAAGATDLRLPPIYPVLLGRPAPAPDINLEPLAVTQTNFEDAPVTLAARITAAGQAGRTLLVDLLDESGKRLEQQRLKVDQEATPLTVRFRLRPQQPGISFYRVRVATDGPVDQASEATLANNARLAVVDRGKGPYRVLYVAGRPNWEYKFLQRALQADDQVQLVGLLRIARREPKFTFLGRAGDTANPLFRGFDNKDREQVEQYDQPVIVRLGTIDENELRGGFPKTADELFRYHAVILDDVEAEFFTQDQMQLLKEFVRQRGGGLLMLGGQESFKNGKFDRTPVGDLLPVYVDQAAPVPPEARFRLTLSREGWLEPWLRLHAEEDAERRRFAAMPAFQTLNMIRGIKPGATVLARATAEGGESVPALVEQRFGHGRAAALLIGDLWRWGLRRPVDTENDMEKAWRQTIRWLVAEVPQRVEIAIEPARDLDEAAGALHLAVQVRDPAYRPLDNAVVNLRITAPDGGTVELRAEPSERRPGVYEAVYIPRQPGAFRVQAGVAAPDGSEVGQAQAGWTADPAAEEFQTLQPNLALLERIARATGGQVVPAADIAAFAAALPTRHAQITEPYTKPLWHQSWVFLLAIACLTAEWGLRRWKGLP